MSWAEYSLCPNGTSYPGDTGGNGDNIACYGANIHYLTATKKASTIYLPQLTSSQLTDMRMAAG